LRRHPSPRLPRLAPPSSFAVFLFHAAATTETYTLSLHDALPISSFNGHCARSLHRSDSPRGSLRDQVLAPLKPAFGRDRRRQGRSEEHTSELQSRENLVCRLLLEKKKAKKDQPGVSIVPQRRRTQ